MIPVIVKSIKKPGSDEKKYYVQIAQTTPITLEQVAKNISGRCTVTETDCIAVLNELEKEVISAMLSGQAVRLGKLGSFRPTVKSAGAVKAELANVSMVNSVHARFTMGSRLRTALLLANTDVQFVFRSQNAAKDSEEFA